ncbi:MAG: Ig-like domain-containing protein, partial [Oscillospiraceae bacterium]|nr:Ig-like domain-containing protein [Oscillospiraceae bacterium]
STNNQTLTESVDYEIKNSTIIFSYTYLDSLFAGEYFLNVYYKPAGENYNVAPTVNSNSQHTTQIKLIVKKDAQSKLAIDGINSPYKYGDTFFVNAKGGNSTGDITYISSDESVASIDKNGQVTTRKVGKFKIIAVKAADENYEETTTLSSEIVVNPKHVYIENIGVKDKIYDTTKVADINYDSDAIINGKLEQDDLTINYEKAKAYFINKNAAANKKVFFSGFSLSGKDVLNYTLSNQPNQASATINKRPVTIQGVSAYDKTYNGTINAEINQIEAKIIDNLDGDNLTLVKGTANFVDQYAGSHKNVNFEGFSLSGSTSSNYFIAAQPTSTFAAIYQKPIAIQGISACNKTYDGTTNTEIMGEATFDENDKIDGDDLTIINGTANFSDKNVGNDKPVYFDGFALAGFDASNYTLLNQPKQVYANINPKDLTITNLSVSDKIYDGLNIAQIDGSPSLEGIIDGDNISIVNGTPSFITL